MAVKTEHVQLIDYFRGIAILAVFLFHCLGVAFGHDQLAWGPWFSDFSTSRSFLALVPVTLGWAGVAIFFVVSGFCIHLSFLNGPANDWRVFFVRRFFRIYPPYLLALIFFACVLPTTRLSFRSLFAWAQAGSHALLVHNLDQRSYFGINSAFWSIAVEVQLYLLYPALLALVRKLGWDRSLFVLGFLEVTMRLANDAAGTATGQSLPRWFSGSPFFYWYSWAIGAALADALVQKRPLPFRSWPVAALAAMAVGTAFIRPLYSLSFLFFAVLTAAVIARWLAAKVPVSPPNRFAVHLHDLGNCSYSFYLLHQPLVVAAMVGLWKLQVLPHLPLLTFMLCAGTYPFIYLLSWGYYRCVELRSIALGKEILRRMPRR